MTRKITKDNKMALRIITLLWSVVFALGMAAHASSADTQQTKTLQLGLIALGYLTGPISGINTAATKSAAQAYVNDKNSSQTDTQKIIDLLLKDLDKAKAREIANNLTTNLRYIDSSIKQLQKQGKNNQTISIRDAQHFKLGNVIVLIGKNIRINSNQRFSGKTKVFIIDSLLQSESRYRNEFDIQFSSNSGLYIINSASDSKDQYEAFTFTYKGKALVQHFNFKHNFGDPWQVSKGHRGDIEFASSTCNITLLENSRSKLKCKKANDLMIEPVLPKGSFTVSLPSYKYVDNWQSHRSLPWEIAVQDTYVSRIDFGIGAGVNLTVKDTQNFSGGWAMCCKGSGTISGLRSNKLFKKQSWSVTSEQGRDRLTLINSTLEGLWPTVWGSYNFTIKDSDLVDPAAGSEARMTIKNSSFDLIRAQDKAYVLISNSRLTNSNSDSKKISAKDRSRILLHNIEGLEQRHIIEVNAGKVTIQK